MMHGRTYIPTPSREREMEREEEKDREKETEEKREREMEIPGFQVLVVGLAYVCLQLVILLFRAAPNSRVMGLTQVVIEG